MKKRPQSTGLGFGHHPQFAAMAPPQVDRKPRNLVSPAQPIPLLRPATGASQGPLPRTPRPYRARRSEAPITRP